MSKPPRIPDKEPTEAEIKDVIKEATGGADFGPDFLNDMLIFFFQEASFLFSGMTTYFILGSYDTYPIRRLHLVESQLNQRHNSYAFVLCDLLDADSLRRAYGVSETEPDRSEEREPGRDSNDEYSFEEHTPDDRCKFWLLATWSDWMIPIFEGRYVGPSIELERIEEEFADKAHIFPLDYDAIDINDPPMSLGIDMNEREAISTTKAYSNTQLDIFSIYYKRNRLYTWANKAELALRVTELP